MTEVILVRQIAARPSIVFDALTTPEGMTSWWGPEDKPVYSAAADVRLGGTFRVSFPCFDEQQHVVTGEFLEVVKPTRIVLSWRWEQRGEPEEQGGTSRVEFRLRATQTGTELTLIHSGLRNEASARSHERGWTAALIKLVRLFARAA
jgi:uncharacterized protein YndB with AHSA1/START domain